MNTQQVAESYLKAFQEGDIDTLTALSADDFTFSGPVPEPLSTQALVGLIKMMKNAFPDINYNAKIQRVEGNVSHHTNQLTGTHTGDLDMTELELGIVRATGKSINMPVETARITVEGDKVVNYHVDPRPDAGLPGILAVLGVGVLQI